MNDCGSSDNNWGCWRSSPELIKAFFPGKTPREIVALGGGKDEYAMPAVAHDDRAMFCAANTTSDGTLNIKGFNGSVPANGEGFDSCWAICKWTNRYSTQYDANMQPITSEGAVPQHDSKYTDTDVPLMRTAEAYMTLAEALYRQGKTGEALEIINGKIRARANATARLRHELMVYWLLSRRRQATLPRQVSPPCRRRAICRQDLYPHVGGTFRQQQQSTEIIRHRRQLEYHRSGH